jgi:hypothetical protein
MIDYEYVRQTASEIQQGNKRILRLPARAEEGRILGGRRTIEASIILGTTEKTDREQFSGDEIKRKQELILEEYALHEAIWFDYAKDIESQWEGVQGRGGQEAEVFRGQKGYLRKIYDYYQNSNSPLEFIDNRISLHNLLFPETRYELLGFTQKHSRFQFILEQPFVVGRNHRKEDNFSKYMENLGYDQIDDTTYHNKYFIISDLHEANVLKSGSGFLFVDTIPAFLDKNMYMDFQII